MIPNFETVLLRDSSTSEVVLGSIFKVARERVKYSTWQIGKWGQATNKLAQIRRQWQWQWNIDHGSYSYFKPRKQSLSCPEGFGRKSNDKVISAEEDSSLKGWKTRPGRLYFSHTFKFTDTQSIKLGLPLTIISPSDYLLMNSLIVVSIINHL